MTMIGGVLIAILVGVTFLFEGGEENEIARQLREAQERAEAQQAAAADPAPRAVAAVSEAKGDFDYYVLALSWSPSFCEANPDARQCGQGLRFMLHGLWPQHERGYPQDCYTDANRRVPNRVLDAYRDLGPSRGLLAHQWRKHGSCTGLDAAGYFEKSRAALARVAIPQSLKSGSSSRRVDPKAIETAFMQANPGLDRDEVTITCKSGDLAEVRVCLTKDLEPRRCGRDVIRDCSQRQVDLPAPR